ncbi:TRAP transporter large permease [Qingshengfaniella alkalisoli]|uniref:TRAP transporter large permease protein n=1 Tax=Qingshengfaniella alkalisoli TaxID=2599296 RepID=A0A5B8IS17_9RHOB|nr:TRAP transporter large permease [Qingshengfaniella alkalisoli]QDY68213.1 TRAP transporter large permease [Qingshengfaniella alkalisoli]
MSALLLMLIIFAVLLLLEVPVAFAMLASSVAYMLIDGIFPVTIIIQRMAPGLESFPFLAIPTFILAGNLLNQTGVAERIFAFALALVGHIRGSLAHVNVMASIIFAGVSGVAAADAAGLGAIEVRAMKKAGFTAEFSAAITAASSIIGPIIPPSVVMVIYAVMAQVSIADMFLAGILPGLMMGAALMITVYCLAVTGRITAPVRPRTQVPEIGHAFLRALPAIAAPVLLVGGLLLGIATPTELGALTCFYAVVLGLTYRSLDWNRLYFALRETIVSCGMILFMIAVGIPFSWIIAVNNLPSLLTESILGISSDPLTVLLIISAGLFIAGMVMEPTPILLIAVPMVYPLIQTVGIDPIHFGVVVVINVVIGITTPPVGMILFIMMDVAKVSMGRLVLAILPFYVPLFLVLGLLIVFPPLTTFLPNLVGD